MDHLPWAVIMIMILMWLGGVAFGVGGASIHLVLIGAVIMLALELTSGQRAAL